MTRRNIADPCHRPRVLHVLGCLSRAGIQSVVMHILRGGSERGYIMDVCLTASGPIGDHAREVLDLGCEILMCDLDRSTLDFRRNFGRILKRQHYAAVHVHLGPLSYPALGVARRRGIRVRIAHFHMSNRSSQRSLRTRTLTHCMTRSTLRSASHVVAVSEANRQSYFGLATGRHPHVRVISNPVSTRRLLSESDRQSARSELGIPDAARVLGHVGRFGPGKNQVALVQVARTLAAGGVPHLLFVGDGPERGQVEDAVAREGLQDYAHFTGSRADVGRWLSAMDVFVFPSLWEGLPLAPIEAQVSGLPVVGYDIPGLREAVRHQDLLVAPDDAEALATVLHPLLNDESRRRSLGQEASQWASRFDVQRIVPQYLEIYDGGSADAR